MRSHVRQVAVSLVFGKRNKNRLSLSVEYGAGTAVMARELLRLAPDTCGD